MSNNKVGFYGTPLTKRLGDKDQDGHATRFSDRRSRLDRQQMVTDDQGRRRFHGAFTGGFTAGYFGTVGTAQGFRPKSFVSHRAGPSRQSENVGFYHKPEDYMDDEDFGEFGIAPKKIRLADVYSNHNHLSNKNTIDNILKPSSNSIGEKILDRLCGGARVLHNVFDPMIIAKDDLHGLGYEGLTRKDGGQKSAFSSSNPLLALLDTGRRLKISGEAFGEGVLADDDDHVMEVDEYGIDTLSDYDFSSRKHDCDKKGVKKQENRTSSCDDLNTLSGFEPARTNSMQPCGTVNAQRYSKPAIPVDWKVPVREKPYIIELPESSGAIIETAAKSSKEFNSKFITGPSISHSMVGNTTLASGLLSYTDLRAQEIEDAKRETMIKDHNRIEDKPSIERQVVEWRPCSLLCKHFNVPNPYPDNKYSGVRPDDLFATDVLAGSTAPRGIKLIAPIEIRKSVFNITFENVESTVKNDGSTSSTNDDNEEDQPQVVILDEDSNHASVHDGRNTCFEAREPDSPDILVCHVKKQEPELIVLSSSSSPSQSPERNEAQHDDAGDIYGPPLPPSLKTLMTAKRHLHRYRSRSPSRRGSESSAHRKHKKHRRKK